MRVALYARVSTVDKGQDPEVQLDDLREYAARRRFEVVDEFDHGFLRHYSSQCFRLLR